MFSDPVNSGGIGPRKSDMRFSVILVCRFRKPSLRRGVTVVPRHYPLNYGGSVACMGAVSSCAVLSSIVKVAPSLLPLLDA
jgi:hypothetical protein